MLNQFGFRREMLYLCTSEEERARKLGSLLFFGPKNGQFTSDVEKFIFESGFSLFVSGFSHG